MSTNDYSTDLERKLREHFSGAADVPLPPDLLDLVELIDRTAENAAWRRIGRRAGRACRQERLRRRGGA
jgi:hypothetical protein